MRESRRVVHGIFEEAVVDVDRRAVDHPDDLILAVQATIPDAARARRARLVGARRVGVVVLQLTNLLDELHRGQRRNGRYDVHGVHDEMNLRIPAERPIVVDLDVSGAQALERLGYLLEIGVLEQHASQPEAFDLLPLFRRELPLANSPADLELGTIRNRCTHADVPAELDEDIW